MSLFPLAGFDGRHVVSKALPELFAARDVAELHRLEGFAAIEEMHVRIYEAGHDKRASVNDDRGLANVRRNIGIRANYLDAVAHDGHGLGPGFVGIAGPDARVRYGQRCSGLVRGFRRARDECENSENEESLQAHRGHPLIVM